MDKIHYEEMKNNLQKLINSGNMDSKDIYIFGHCNATEELVDLLLQKNYSVKGILDNNINKQGGNYRDIPIINPNEILSSTAENTIVLIASRAYAAMAAQLMDIGYNGRIEKVVDYNTFAEYSLSKETIDRKFEHVQRGINELTMIKEDYCGKYIIVCPYSALGDVYYAMSYLPYYLQNKGIQEYVIVAVGNACAKVAGMFSAKYIEIISQKTMDELVQAILYTGERNTLISHHDRPYTNKMIQALKVKLIRFEDFYKCGVYGLNQETLPMQPTNCKVYKNIDIMDKGKTVILSPYSKSVAGVNKDVWIEIISYYKNKGYKIFTNVAGEEEAFLGTDELRVSLDELKSAVEYAGTFIGIRSGLCDVIKDAECKKIALYPDCYYSDTRWKVIDFFCLDGWKNIEVK